VVSPTASSLTNSWRASGNTQVSTPISRVELKLIHLWKCRSHRYPSCRHRGCLRHQKCHRRG
jgi:hypothetical protein